MSSTISKVQSSNRIAVVLDGKQIGTMQSVSMNDDYSPEPASGIGDIHAIEYVPTMARHTINVSSMVLKQKSLRDLGVFMENGDEVLQGIVFDIEIMDKDDGTLLRKYVNCSYASGSVEVTKHAIVMGSGVFNALDVVGTGG